MPLTTDVLSARTRSLVAFYLLEYRKLMRRSGEWNSVYYAQQFYDGAQACKGIAQAFKGTGDFDTLLAQCQYNADNLSLPVVQRSWWADARMNAAALVAERNYLRSVTSK